jgi:hypothetical protein
VEVVVKNYFIALAVLLLSACSNPFGGDGSQVDPGHSPGIEAYKLPNGKGAEPVAGSAQNLVSVNRHYRLEGSIANHADGVKIKTARGYTLYSNVQGQLVSGEAQ